MPRSEAIRNLETVELTAAERTLISLFAKFKARTETAEVLQGLFSSVPDANLAAADIPATLESLVRKSLLEKKDDYYTLK